MYYQSTSERHLTIHDIRARHPNSSIADGADLQYLGYEEDSPPPLATPTLSDVQAAKLDAIDFHRDMLQQVDFAYDFGITEAIDDSGTVVPAGVRLLQMRRNPDQTNWQALQSQAMLAVMTGNSGLIMPMRAEDNWNVQTTAMDVLTVTSAMFQRNAALLFVGGAMKTAVRAMTEVADVEAFDETVGWPSSE